MPYLRLLCAALLLAACPPNDSDKKPLNCAANQTEVELCCLEPDPADGSECTPTCVAKCNSDADCKNTGDRCIDGACGPDDDCSI